MANIVERVKEIVAEQLGVDLETVTPQSTISEDLGADSLDAVELIMACEEEFEVEIPDEDAEKMITVQDIIDFVQNHAD